MRAAAVLFAALAARALAGEPVTVSELPTLSTPVAVTDGGSAGGDTLSTDGTTLQTLAGNATIFGNSSFTPPSTTFTSSGPPTPSANTTSLSVSNIRSGLPPQPTFATTPPSPSPTNGAPFAMRNVWLGLGAAVALAALQL